MLSPELVKQMLEVLPNAQTVDIPKAAHMVYEDNPDDFLAAVRAWL